MANNNVSGASLSPIYQRLNGAPRYHPLEADTFADWSLEAGDIVTVSRDGKSYQSPVHTSQMTWKRQQQISLSSKGNEKRGSISKLSQQKYNKGSGGVRNSDYIHLYVEDQYKQMRSGLELTSSSAKLYSENLYLQMRSGLELTASTAFLYVDDAYNQMSSGLAMTSSSAALYVDNKYTQMTAGLKLSSSSAALYVDNKYTQMTAGLKLTSSSAALYVDNKYTQMTAGLKLTSSSAALYVDNKYTQMTAGLKLSSSSAALYVDNKYTQMTAGLKLTSSSAALYVDNKYTQMTAGLNLTSSSAALYTQNRTTRAWIMTRINADGEGEALIEADKVKISGTTTINDVMTVISNAVGFSKPVICSDNLNINSTGVLNLYTATFQGTNPISLNALTLASAIKNASVSNNILTLTKFDGTEINFSKATTLNGGWDGSGTFTVNASPQGISFSTVIVQGAAAWSGNTATVPVEAFDSDNPQYQYATGRDIIVDATARYNAGEAVGYNNGYIAGGRTAHVSGSNSITRNGTYTYKGMYENRDGDDVETGNNLSVTVNVSGGGSISSIDMISTSAGSSAVSGYTWSGSLTKPSGNAWLRISLSGGDKLYYDVT